jgi:Glutathione S-transferase, C-terminal domain
MLAGKTVTELMKDKDARVRLEAAKYYTARRMGWKETNVNEQVGKDGGPIETKDVSAIDIIRARIASASARLEEGENPSESVDAWQYPRRMQRTLNEVPRVAALHRAIAQRPRIRAYLDSNRRIAFNEQGIFRHYPELDG